MQAERQPEYPLLYSLAGLPVLRPAPGRGRAGGLDGTGGAAPAGSAGDLRGGGAAGGANAADCGGQQLRCSTSPCDHLTLARCALYADRLAGRPPGPEAAGPGRARRRRPAHRR